MPIPPLYQREMKVHRWPCVMLTQREKRNCDKMSNRCYVVPNHGAGYRFNIEFSIIFYFCWYFTWTWKTTVVFYRRMNLLPSERTVPDKFLLTTLTDPTRTRRYVGSSRPAIVVLSNRRALESICVLMSGMFNFRPLGFLKKKCPYVATTLYLNTQQSPLPVLN